MSNTGKSAAEKKEPETTLGSRGTQEADVIATMDLSYCRRVSLPRTARTDSLGEAERE